MAAIINFEAQVAFISEHAGVTKEAAWKYVAAEDCFYHKAGLNDYGEGNDGEDYIASLHKMFQLTSDEGIEDEIDTIIDPDQKCAYISRKTGIPLVQVGRMENANLFYMVEIGADFIAEDEIEDYQFDEEAFCNRLFIKDKDYVWSGPVPDNSLPFN